MVRYHLCGWGSSSADCWKLPPTLHFIIYCVLAKLPRQLAHKTVTGTLHTANTHDSSALLGLLPTSQLIWLWSRTFSTSCTSCDSALDNAAFMRASNSSSAMSSQREREFCSFLGSLLPVFEFTDARLRGGHGGEVRVKASSMWVGAQAWRRARVQGDRRRLPTPFRREIQPTAKLPPVLVVENPRSARDSTRKRDTTRDEEMEEPTREVKDAIAKSVTSWCWWGVPQTHLPCRR